MSDSRVMNADEADVDLMGLLGAIWRSMFAISIFVLSIMGIAYFVLLNITPIYTSEVTVLIESRATPFTQTESEQRNFQVLLDSEAVESQVQVIRSRDLAISVVEKLGLNKLEEFGGEDRPSGLGRLLVLIGLKRDKEQLAPTERVLEQFAENLSAYAVDGSRVITVQFASKDPSTAAKVANAVAEEFLAIQKNSKRDNTRGATVWLEREIDDLRNKVAEAESAVEAFRASSDLLLGQNNVSLNAQRLSELNTQLTRARGQKSEAAARAKQIKALLNSGSSLDAASEIINSPLIQRLQERQVTLRAQIAELSSTLLPGHPRIKELNAQSQDLTRQIRAEASKVARSIENNAKIAASREASLQKELGQLKAESASFTDDEIKLRALEREARAQRELLESFLSRFREAAARENAAALPPDARVISSAAVKSKPAYPNVSASLLATFVAALILSILYIIARELLSGRAFSRTAPAGTIPTVPMKSPDNAPAMVETDELGAQALEEEFGQYSVASPGAADDGDVSAVSEQPTNEQPNPASRPVPVSRSHTAADNKGGCQPAPVEDKAPPRVNAEFPCAVHIPHIESVADDRPSFASMDDLGSDYSMAVLDLASVVQDCEPQIVAVSGTNYGIGTTTTAISLARAYARAEAKVVFVEAVMEAETAESYIGDTELRGLTDLLAGNASFGDVIYRDRVSPVHIIPVGIHPVDREAAYADEVFDTVLAALVQTYDVVVLDAGVWTHESSHVLHRADAIVLATSSMATVDAVRHSADRLDALTPQRGEVVFAVLEETTASGLRGSVGEVAA